MFFGGDPFEHFGHHGGGGGGRARRPAADVDTTKLYETLGVRDWNSSKENLSISLSCQKGNANYCNANIKLF